jgi:hypothetical protein
MGTVTVFTAARTLAIEANAIINGAINGSGQLILSRNNGTTINAGQVVGPTGAKGDTGIQGAAGPAGAQGPAGSVTWASMPAQLCVVVSYTGTAPARPTSRTDIVVRWRGPDVPAGALAGDEFVSTA